MGDISKVNTIQLFIKYTVQVYFILKLKAILYYRVKVLSIHIKTFNILSLIALLNL